MMTGLRTGRGYLHFDSIVWGTGCKLLLTPEITNPISTG